MNVYTLEYHKICVLDRRQLGESILSFCLVGPGDSTQIISLPVSAFPSHGLLCSFPVCLALLFSFPKVLGECGFVFIVMYIYNLMSLC